MSALTFKARKPSEPGAYWVRNFDLHAKDRVALVSVTERGGALVCNLHETNSEFVLSRWYEVQDLTDKIEWCGPLVRLPTNRERLNRMDDASMRVAHIFDIGSIFAGFNSLPSALHEFVEDSSDEELQALFGESFGRCFKECQEDLPLAESFTEAAAAARIYGFVLVVERPVPMSFSENGETHSWGHYAVRAFYADQLTDCYEQAHKWADEYVARKRQEAQAGAA